MHLFLMESIEIFKTPILGEVTKGIGPGKQGRVKCAGSHWPAKFYQSETSDDIAVGQVVNVIGRQGITLLVTLNSNKL